MAYVQLPNCCCQGNEDKCDCACCCQYPYDIYTAIVSEQERYNGILRHDGAIVAQNQTQPWTFLCFVNNCGLHTRDGTILHIMNTDRQVGRHEDVWFYMTNNADGTFTLQGKINIYDSSNQYEGEFAGTPITARYSGECMLVAFQYEKRTLAGFAHDQPVLRTTYISWDGADFIDREPVPGLGFSDGAGPFPGANAVSWIGGKYPDECDHDETFPRIWRSFNGCISNIMWFHGFVPPSQLANIYAQCSTVESEMVDQLCAPPSWEVDQVGSKAATQFQFWGPKKDLNGNHVENFNVDEDCGNNNRIFGVMGQFRAA